MRQSRSIEWTRSRLEPQEREELSAALTPQQKTHLLHHDYVWIRGVGVLWNPPDGEPLRRARFTHGAHFRTQRGEFYIDSEGSARALAERGFDPLRPAARLSGSPGSTATHDDLRSGGSSDDALPPRDSG